MIYFHSRKWNALLKNNPINFNKIVTYADNPTTLFYSIKKKTKKYALIYPTCPEISHRCGSKTKLSVQQSLNQNGCFVRGSKVILAVLICIFHHGLLKWVFSHNQLETWKVMHWPCKLSSGYCSSSSGISGPSSLKSSVSSSNAVTEVLILPAFLRALHIVQEKNKYIHRISVWPQHLI